LVHQEGKAFQEKFLSGDPINKRITISLLNIRGISKQKLVELINTLENQDNFSNVICLIETHEKKKIVVLYHYNYAANRRLMDDKRGGDLMMLCDGRTEINKIETISQDILHVEININKRRFFIVLVYMDINIED